MTAMKDNDVIRTLEIQAGTAVVMKSDWPYISLDLDVPMRPHPCGDGFIPDAWLTADQAEALADLLRWAAEWARDKDNEGVSTLLSLCADCGIKAWGFEEDGQVVHEDFYVHDKLWNAVVPEDTDDDGVVLCIGCFEQRLGRKLTHQDFESDSTQRGAPAFIGIPPSKRYANRWNT